MYWLGIDLGGTNIAAGVVDENYKIIGTGKCKTNAGKSADEIADDMAAAAFDAIKDAGIEKEQISSMGIGAPGSIIAETGVVAFANNLGFENVPLCDMLQARTGFKTYIENDANAAAFGELLAGAGKGKRSFVAITLGTGVGGGIIIDNKMLSGFNNVGGELGHTVMVYNGEPCTCGRKGCFEAYASATALIRQTKAAMLKDKSSIMWELVGGNIDATSGRTAFDAMRKGDKSAKEVVDKYTEYIAVGVTNMVNIFQPETLCIGGGISKEGETLVAPIREYVNRTAFSKNLPEKDKTEIKAAELGNDAGIIGAAMLYKLH